MKTKNMKTLLSATAVAAALVACFGLAACGGSASSSAAASNASASASSAAASSAAASSAAASSAASSSAAAGAVGEEAGFTEYPIFEDVKAGFLNVSGVYFQPVPMTDGSTIEGKDIHIEADISALENNFGYGVGDWVPYLSIGYKVTAQDGNVVAEGTFMPMSASDGPHYGANIAMPGQGTYTLEFTINNPGESYLLHTDAETGPGATSWDDGVSWPLVVTEQWDYVPVEF